MDGWMEEADRPDEGTATWINSHIAIPHYVTFTVIHIKSGVHSAETRNGCYESSN
jgi:hypothetical protein